MKIFKIDLLLIFLILAGCGAPQTTSTSALPSTALPQATSPSPGFPQPSPTSPPSTTPTEEPLLVWDFVALGDSRTRRATWPETYAQYIEQDLGVQVNFIDRAINGMPSERILELLRENDSLIDQIREAEVVTVFTNDLTGQELFLFREGLDECPTTKYEDLLGDIVKEIFALRGDQSTVIRLFENYNFPGVMDEAAIFLEAKIPCTMKYNVVVHRVAGKYSIPVVPLFEAFNGPDGDQNPDDMGYLSDGVHTSPAGDQVIADLLRAMGYNMVPSPSQ